VVGTARDWPSDITIAVNGHRSIRGRTGVKNEARHPGGINLFGRRFGNHDQDIVMRLVRT
jgi:predicted transcriptional regulator